MVGSVINKSLKGFKNTLRALLNAQEQYKPGRRYFSKEYIYAHGRGSLWGDGEEPINMDEMSLHITDAIEEDFIENCLLYLGSGESTHKSIYGYRIPKDKISEVEKLLNGD